MYVHSIGGLYYVGLQGVRVVVPRQARFFSLPLFALKGKLMLMPIAYWRKDSRLGRDCPGGKEKEGRSKKQQKQTPYTKKNPFCDPHLI